jgi:hypothetical protein
LIFLILLRKFYVPVLGGGVPLAVAGAAPLAGRLLLITAAIAATTITMTTTTATMYRFELLDEEEVVDDDDCTTEELLVEAIEVDWDGLVVIEVAIEVLMDVELDDVEELEAGATASKERSQYSRPVIACV